MWKNRLLIPTAQIIRYGLVGLLNNCFGYLVYLLLTWYFVDPKVAVIILYPIGALIGYYGNAKFAFYSDLYLSSLLRYILAHFIGFVSNVAILYTFVDLLGYPHTIIQAIAIFVVAGVLFVLFRYYVFPQEAL